MDETTPRARLRPAGLLAAAALALALTGCLPEGPSHRGLVIYNGQHPQTTAALVRAFEHQTGIEVSVRSDDEDVLAGEIAAEGSRSPADIIYAENSPALEFLQTKGLLARLPSGLLAEVPARYSSPAKKWVGVSARVSVLVYNNRLVRRSQLPRSVLQLASPRWRGKLAIAPDETDFQPVVSAVAHRYGKRRAISWLEGLGRNGAAHTYADNEALTAAVNSGQASLGLIDQYYWYRMRDEMGQRAVHSSIAPLSRGDAGYVVDVSGAGILRSSRHKQAAERFLSFLVSSTGQRIIARSDSFEYPLRGGIRPRAGQPALSSLHPYRIGLAQLGDGAEAVALMRRASLLP